MCDPIHEERSRNACVGAKKGSEIAAPTGVLGTPVVRANQPEVEACLERAKIKTERCENGRYAL